MFLVTKKFFNEYILKKVRMKKICCIKCNKYRKLNNPKISYIFDKVLVLSSICDKCGGDYEKNI